MNKGNSCSSLHPTVHPGPAARAFLRFSSKSFNNTTLFSSTVRRLVVVGPFAESLTNSLTRDSSFLCSSVNASNDASTGGFNIRRGGGTGAVAVVSGATSVTSPPNCRLLLEGLAFLLRPLVVFFLSDDIYLNTWDIYSIDNGRSCDKNI